MNCNCPIVKLLEQHKYVKSEFVFPSKILPLIANPDDNFCRKCGNIIYNKIDTICETCQEMKQMLVNANQVKVNTPLVEKDILSFPKDNSKEKTHRKYHKKNPSGRHVGRPSKNSLISPKTPKSAKSPKSTIKSSSISPRISKRQKRYREEPVQTQEKNNIEWVKFEPPHKIRKTPMKKGLKLCQICRKTDIIEVENNYNNGVDEDDDDGDFIWCFDCGRAFHTHCIYEGINIKLNRKVYILRTSGWRCPDCKYCEQCKEYEVDNPVIMCECCDRGFHISCLKPKLDKIPETEWICPYCIISDDKIVKEEVNYIEKQIMKLKCGVCKDGNLNGCPWLLCRLCNKGIHKACDVQYLKALGMKKINKYLCPSCRCEKENDDNKIESEEKEEDGDKINEKEKEEKDNVEDEEGSFVL